MSILNTLISFPFARRLNSIDFFKKYPQGVQEEVFFDLINKAKNTAWGKKYNYTKICQEGDFKTAFQLFSQQVPLSSYDDLKPFIDRARHGEANVLWPGNVKWFAKSSGTTSDKSKFIPVTEESLQDCHYRGGRDSIALYLNKNPETKLFKGKTLSLGGSKRQDELNPANYCGDLSAILMDNLPFWAQWVRSPELPVALMDEWEAKLKEISKATINENIVALAGVPSWMLVIIRRILADSGKSNIKELWPNLELFIHGGVSFKPYQKQYEEICGSDMKYLEVYNASEGFFGIADNDNKDMLLMLDYGVFYEFIPLEGLNEENSQPISLSVAEVELDKNYALTISSSGGLWRYLIGDTIKFTSLNPHRFIISGRTKHFINIFGEELMVDNTDQAIAIVSEKTGASIKEYTVAPIFMTENQQGGHEWLIEFIKEPADIASFITMLDETIQSLNSDYEAKRYKNITLGELKLVVARENLFHDWLANKNKLGGQNKVPRLSNNRQYLEELLELL